MRFAFSFFLAIFSLQEEISHKNAMKKDEEEEVKEREKINCCSRNISLNSLVVFGSKSRDFFAICYLWKITFHSLAKMNMVRCDERSEEKI